MPRCCAGPSQEFLKKYVVNLQSLRDFAFEKCLILASLEKWDVLARRALVSTWSPPAGGSQQQLPPPMGRVFANSLQSHLAGASPLCYLPGPCGSRTSWLHIRATNVQVCVYVFLNFTSTHRLNIISPFLKIKERRGGLTWPKYQRAYGCPSGIWTQTPLFPRPACVLLCLPAFRWAWDPCHHQPSPK